MKTKKLVSDFYRRTSPHTTPIKNQGLDIDIVVEYKYLDVHPNKLDCTTYADA